MHVYDQPDELEPGGAGDDGIGERVGRHGLHVDGDVERIVADDHERSERLGQRFGRLFGPGELGRGARWHSDDRGTDVYGEPGCRDDLLVVDDADHVGLIIVGLPRHDRLHIDNPNIGNEHVLLR